MCVCVCVCVCECVCVCFMYHNRWHGPTTKGTESVKITETLSQLNKPQAANSTKSTILMHLKAPFHIVLATVHT